MTRIHGDFHLGQVLVVERRRLHHRLRGRARPAARRAPRQDEPDGRRRGADALARLRRRHDARSQDTDLRAAGRGDRARSSSSACATARRRPSSTPTAPASATCPASTTATCSTFFMLEKAAYELLYEASNRPAWLSIPLHGLQRLMIRILGDDRRSAVMTAHAVDPAGAVRGRKPTPSRTAGMAIRSRCWARATPRRAASSAPSCPARRRSRCCGAAIGAVDRHARAAQPDGLFDGTVADRAPYLLAHHLAGRGAGDRGSLFLRPAARRSRPASVRRGPPFRAGQGARRPRHDPRRRRPACGFAVWAPNASARRRGRRLQCLGLAAPSDAAALSAPASGSCSCRACAGRALQVRHRRRGRRAAAAEGRSARQADRAAAGDRLHRRLARAVPTGTTTPGWRAARRARPRTRRSRSTRSISAPGCAPRPDAGTTRPTG